MGKLVVLVTQLHGVLTCACDCITKNACLPLLAEINLPQTTQNCRDDGKSSAAISGTDLTLRVRYSPANQGRPSFPEDPPTRGLRHIPQAGLAGICKRQFVITA